MEYEDEDRVALEDALSSLENAEITELAYEQRDLEDTSAALTDLADELVPEGCISVGNEHGACMDRGCRWCWVYYEGKEGLID